MYQLQSYQPRKENKETNRMQKEYQDIVKKEEWNQRKREKAMQERQVGMRLI